MAEGGWPNGVGEYRIFTLDGTPVVNIESETANTTPAPAEVMENVESETANTTPAPAEVMEMEMAMDSRATATAQANVVGTERHGTATATAKAKATATAKATASATSTAQAQVEGTEKHPIAAEVPTGEVDAITRKRKMPPPPDEGCSSWLQNIKRMFVKEAADNKNRKEG